MAAGATTKAKRGYTRETVKLTKAHVNRAERMLLDGKVPGRGMEWGDTEERGLTLRLTPQALTWYLRTRTDTVKLGAYHLLDVTQARFAAEKAKVGLRQGDNMKFEMSVFHNIMARTGGDLEVVGDVAFPDRSEPPPVPSMIRRRNGPWFWEDMIEEFLDYKATKVEASYLPKYAKYLRHPGYACLEGMLVCTITVERLQEIRDEIIANYSLSTAARCVNQARDAFDWTWRTHSGKSGLARAEEKWPMWREQWHVEYKSGKRKHTPTLTELARTLALAERHRSLGQTEHGTSAGTLGLLWFTVLTGQRTGQVAKTELDQVGHISQDTGVPGDDWVAVTWQGPQMKSRRQHVLPLPPAAWRELEGLLAPARAKSNRWLFPPKRGAGHASAGSMNQVLFRLAGKRHKQPDPKRVSPEEPIPDLLTEHGIRKWTLHDVRRSITEFLVDRRLGGAASAILDHEIAGAKDLREQTASVTRLHYDTAQRIALKAEGMALWCDALLAEVERERASLALQPLPAPRPRPKRKPAKCNPGRPRKIAA